MKTLETTVLFLIISGLSIVSCQSLFVGPDPDNTRLKNFEILWKTIDRHYSFFDCKKIDWDSVYNLYLPAVSECKDDSIFFLYCCGMCNGLRDGHVNLYRGNQYSCFDFKSGYPLNAAMLDVNKDLSDFDTLHKPFVYGSISGTSFGYISIRDFGQGGDYLASGNVYKYIDTILYAFRNKSALIIDVRDNGGGNDYNAQEVASHFIDKESIYEYTRFRDGEKHDDFSPWEASYIKPSSGITVKVPVAVLINRGCYSTCEAFIRMMSVAPNAFSCGGYSGGGNGNPVTQELPNGWTFRLSTSQVVDVDMKNTEEVGIAPDFEINLTPEDIRNGYDAILEKAKEILEGKISVF